jgi:hypothetical protein
MGPVDVVPMSRKGEITSARTFHDLKSLCHFVCQLVHMSAVTKFPRSLNRKICMSVKWYADIWRSPGKRHKAISITKNDGILCQNLELL